MITGWFRPSPPKIRTFERSPEGVREVPFQALEKRNPAGLAISVVSQEALEDKKQEVYAERHQQIYRPSPAQHGPAVAKDASLNPSAFHMVYDPTIRPAWATLRRWRQWARSRIFT